MHGKHVLCAGPLAHTAAPAGKALEAVRAARVALYVAHDGRAAPEEAALARQIDQGAVGSAGFVRIHRSGPARRGAGAIEAILPRDLDWLVRRFGPPARLFAHSVHRPGLSHASLTLTFASGPLVQWIATCGAPDRTLIEICGTAGMVQFTSDEAVLEVTPGGKGATPAYRVSPIAHGVQARHLVHFLASAERAGSEATCDHEFAIVRMVEAALRSARTGNEMRL
jgi:predicted dehydrogenase